MSSKSSNQIPLLTFVFWLLPFTFHLLPFLSTFAVQIHQMIYSVQVTVMPLKDLLDPQGKAVMGGLKNLGIQSVQDVRIGKNINLQVEANSPEQAKQLAEDASRKLLANPVMEFFEVSVHE